jgi:hypothetical protein
MNQQNSKRTSEEDKERNASGGGQVELGFLKQRSRERGESSVNKSEKNKNK